MKYLLIPFILLFLVSCSEEECQTCSVIKEDNIAAVELFCQGLTTDLDFYQTQTEETATYCDDEIAAVKARQEVNETIDICGEVLAIVRTRVICN